MNSEVANATTRRASLATVLACALVGAGALTGITSTFSSAQAAEIDAVTGATIRNQSTPDGPNYVYDNFKATFSFDTTGKSVAENDTLKIQLPSDLRTRETSFDVNDKDTGDVALKCHIPNGEGQVLTCVFTDFVKTHENTKGDIHVVADATRESSSGRFSFTINHKVTVEAAVPNGKIVKNTKGYAPETAYKYGWQLHNGNTDRFTWEVYISERKIQSDTITITDTFDTSLGGYKLFNEPGVKAWQRTRLMKWNSLADFKADASHQKFVESVQVGEAINGGTFTLTETADGFVASFPNTKSDAYYLLKYYTKLNVPENAKVGSVFKNTAVVNGQTAEKSIAIDTAGWGDVDGDLKMTTSPTRSTTSVTPPPAVTTTDVPKRALARTGADLAPVAATAALMAFMGVAILRRRQNS